VNPSLEPNRYPGSAALLSVVAFDILAGTGSLLEAPAPRVSLTYSKFHFADSLIGACARRLRPGAASIERIECDAKLLCVSPGQVQVLDRS
jgi:hypothetical protein